MFLSAAIWCLFTEFNALYFHQLYTKTYRLYRLLSRFTFFFFIKKQQSTPSPAFFPLICFPPIAHPPPPTAKITLHLVFVELQSFPFQNITWHLPTGTVEARPIVSFHSVFHLIAIRGQLFPIRLAVCGLDSRGFKETISGLKAALYSYTDRSVSSDCYSY